jgi:radical SAM protein with 4Fe4S-binding SPASM domain
MSQPTYAIIAVTLKCNAKCIMCDIWKRKSGREVEPAFYQRLPSSLREVNITGGEPFLRENLPEIIEVIHSRCDSPRIVISSNGLLPKRIKDSMDRIIEINDGIAVRISIDAVGKKHDELRGMPGAFGKAMESLSILKKNGVRDLGIALTLMDSNVSEVNKVYDLADEMGVEFSLSVVTSSPIYFGEKDSLMPSDNGALRERFNYLVRSELRHWRPRRFARAYFDNTLWEYLHTKRRPLRCDAGKGFFYLTPDGNLYGCDVLDFPLGNLKDHGFKELWFSERAEKFRRRANECNRCWMICTAKTAMRRSLHKPFSWLLKNKLRVHMGAQIL